MATNKGWSLSRSSARGRVFKRGRTWYFEVRDSDGKVVLQDNTGSFPSIVSTAHADVGAVRRIENAGHRLRFSYPQLVDLATGLAS